MVHKTWTTQEVRELIKEWKKAGGDRSVIPVLAKRFDRSPEAVAQKLRRLGLYRLNVVGGRADITTTFESVKVLPSLEEVLKILAGALQKATEPGLSRVELQRLDKIGALFSKYADGLEKFVRYREIEEKLVELEEKYSRLAKERTKEYTSKSGSA